MIAESRNEGQETQLSEHKSVKRHLAEAMAEMILLFICMAPGLYLSAQALQEPWTMIRIARSSLSLQQNHVATFVTSAAGYRGEHIGGEMMQVALVGATNLRLEDIGLLPVGSLFLAIMYYAVAKVVSRSRWTAAAITLYASWYYPLLYSQYGTQTYVWSHILFLTFLLLFLLWLRSRRPVLSVLIMAVFVASFLHYHTTPLWIITAITTAVAGIKIKERSQPIARRPVSWAIAFFCIVIYFAFDTVIYGNGLARLSTGAIGESFAQSIISKIITPLFFRESQLLSPFQIAPVNPAAATFTTLFVLLILVIPVMMWCLNKVHRAVANQDVAIAVKTSDDIFVWTLVVAAMAHIVLYSAYGAFSFRVIPIAFPMLLPIVARESRFGALLERGLTSALAVLAVVGFFSFAPTLLPDSTASQIGLASKLFEAGDRLMGDANTYGSVLLNTARDGQVVDFVWLDTNMYASLVGDQPQRHSEFDYVIADATDKPIIALSWIYLEPWTHHLREVAQNPSLDKIYDSENLAVFQPSGKVRSSYQLGVEDIDMRTGSSNQWDSLWLCLTLLMLFFLPGVALLVIISRRAVVGLDDVHALSGLTIGSSVTFTTFIGYLTNFSPLGLTWFVPLSIGLPWGALLIVWVLRRNKFRVSSALVAYAVSVVIAVIVWAFLSIRVAGIRASRHAEFTEFFVTRDATQADIIKVNVVNRLAKPQDFSIVVKPIDSEPEQTIGQRILASGAVWIETMKAPHLQTNEQWVITLEKNGDAYRELILSEAPP